MPVRKVSNRGGNIIGRFPSLKMKRMVAFESLIERDYLYLLDYEQNIEWFEEQPLTIEYQHESKTLHYTADFHLVECGQDVLVECKPHTLTGTAENQRKFGAARVWCAQKGWVFRIVTDEGVRTGFRLQNVKLLTRHARHSVRPELKACIVALLCMRQAAVAVDDLVQELWPEEPVSVVAAILHMAFHHEIVISLDGAPISGRTPVGLPQFEIEEVGR